MFLKLNLFQSNDFLRLVNTNKMLGYIINTNDIRNFIYCHFERDHNSLIVYPIFYVFSDGRSSPNDEKCHHRTH